MEKWAVVVAIWTMCAMCAVLFIRGATRDATRSVRAARGNAHAGRARDGKYEAHDA
ncbi:hypothetical protein [Paraburkholderia solisilvae]|uniref:Uncharacterized protein n=1 Tax=Paraburkholderia solisilvae TaxID=624376 RepID=A0A6J5E297_9BURK|nr:hypothetical protein [Paraburkholderia solisilvae]CAB3760560.1 hypothetical protein LMG29739_03425 [Paraburkholderia solisilvae]